MLNSHSLYRIEYYSRQDSSEVGSFCFCLRQMLPQPSLTMLSRKARQGQWCSVPSELMSISAQQGWWEHAVLAWQIVHNQPRYLCLLLHSAMPGSIPLGGQPDSLRCVDQGVGVWPEASQTWTIFSFLPLSVYASFLLLLSGEIHSWYFTVCFMHILVDKFLAID